MEEDQRQVLNNYYKKIVTSVQLHNVAPQLVSEGILTIEDFERISAGETNQCRMAKLMNIVVNSSKVNVFETFVKTLEEDQEDWHMAKQMRESLRKIRISQRMKRQPCVVRNSACGEPPEHQIEHTIILGSSNCFTEQDSSPGDQDPGDQGAGVAAGAAGGAGEHVPFHPALRGTYSAPPSFRPDQGASPDPRRSKSYNERRNAELSYWVPQNDFDLYCVVVNKTAGDGTHGLSLENNSSIGGFTVTEIASGSAAESSYLQKHDVIRTVNGENICSRSMENVKEMLTSAEKRFILGIVRSNQRVERQYVDLRMKREPGLSYGFAFICGEEWPRFNGDFDCYISEISAGGLADRFGLKVNDTLVRVNEKNLQRLPYGVVMRVLLPEINNPAGAVLTVERAEFEWSSRSTTGDQQSNGSCADGGTGGL